MENADYEKYKDIIDMEHPKSKVHPQMSRYDRAAQFAPFAALTGYDSAIKETGRLTNERIILDEEERELLDVKLKKAIDAGSSAVVEIEYFEEDKLKDGGEYLTVRGQIKKLDSVYKLIYIGDKIIKIDDIYNIDIIDN